MLVMTLRTLILYIIVLIVIRIMGKRELGQLQPFEFVVAILIADLVSVPMSNTGVPIFYGIIPVLTLLIAHLTISQISLKSVWFRNAICGKPSIIISNGEVDESMMRKLRYNLDDLFEQLRENDIFSIEDVEYAILETSGRMSFIPKAKNKSLVLSDIKDSFEKVWIPRNVIIDGIVDNNELYLSGYSIKSLKEKLKQEGYQKTEDIFICTTCKQDRLFIQPKKLKKVRFMK